MPNIMNDVRQISHIAYGFFLSKALFSALNIELFGHLAEGPADVDTLNRRTGVGKNRLWTLISALLSVGLLSREGDKFRNSPAAQRYLVPGAPAYFGDYYRFQIDRQFYPMMKGLDAGLAGNEDGLAHQSMSDWLSEDEAAEDFSRAQHAGSTGPAIVMADAIDLTGAKSLLDVAGGTGAFSMAFCRKNSDLTACIIDFQSVVKTAEGFVNHAGMQDRISFISGDALENSWPAEQDVVLMSYLLGAVGGGDITPLLQKAWHALKPSGKLILHDFMLEDDRSGPTAAAGFFLSYIAIRTDSVSFTAAELKEWTETAGFTDVESAVMIPEITKIVTATKPA